MELQIALSVIEAVALVAVLVYFLRRIDSLLGRIQGNLVRISEGVAAVKGHCEIIGPGAEEINRRLGVAAAGLTQAAEEAEALA